MRQVKPRVFSLFSGIGGSSLGYELAGFESLGAVEFLDYQAANYRANFKAAVLEEDIRSLDPLKVAAGLGIRPGELDVLDGSPPCSSFSVAGRRSESWGEEKSYGNRKQRTDDLFFEYVRFLKGLKPRAFVAENVPGLNRGPSKGYLKEIGKALAGAGYRVSARILNAANYGVPQARVRLIFIGLRKDQKGRPAFPRPAGRVVGAGQALESVKNSPEDLLEVDVRRFALYAPMKTLPPGGQSEKKFSLIKAHPDAPCPTITATSAVLSAYSVFHWDNRKFTIPELKRLCSFPDSWTVIGKDYRQRAEGFGRAVPPLLMKAVAGAVKKSLGLG